MDLNYFSPLPLFWGGAAIFLILAWLVTIRAGLRMKAFSRALAIAIVICPAFVAVAGHSAAGSGIVPMLALLVRGVQQPALLLLAALNAFQLFIIWLVIGLSLHSFYRTRALHGAS